MDKTTEQEASTQEQTPSSTQTTVTPAVDKQMIEQLVDQKFESSNPEELRQQVKQLQDTVRELAKAPTPDNSSSEDVYKKVSVLFDPNADPEEAKKVFMEIGKASGRPDAELQAVLNQYNTSAETEQSTQEQEQEKVNVDSVYARQAFKQMIDQRKSDRIDSLLSKDDAVAAIMNMKREIEGEEAANAALAILKDKVSKRTNDLLTRTWDSKPADTPFDLEWIEQAGLDAYNTEVEFLKTVVVDPARTSKRAPDAAGQTSILDSDPVKPADEALLKSDPKEYVRQSEAYIKDRTRRAAIQRGRRSPNSQA